jgi:hypothetical protein
MSRKNIAKIPLSLNGSVTYLVGGGGSGDDDDDDDDFSKDIFRTEQWYFLGRNTACIHNNYKY